MASEPLRHGWGCSMRRAAWVGLLAVLTQHGSMVTCAQTDRLTDAEALYHAGHYTQAASVFQKLMAQTPNRDTQAFCLLRLGDCFWVGEWWPPSTAAEPDPSPDQYYDRVLTRGYSPYLAEAFEKWRAAYQAWWHGVSNGSEVPSAAYQAKRRAVLEVIAGYLASHPQDAVALAQQTALEQVPEIARGGPMGSTVLNHMGVLWPETLQLESPKQAGDGAVAQ